MKYLILLMMISLDSFAELQTDISLNYIDNSNDTYETNHLYTDLNLEYTGSFSKNELNINFNLQSSKEVETHFIPQDINLKRSFDKGFEILLGTEIFNISIMEAFKTSNVFNAKDFTNDFLDPQDIGESIISFSKQLESNKSFQLFYHFNYAANEYPESVQTNMGEVSFREDEVYEVLNGLEPPSSSPPNKVIVSTIISSYGSSFDWKIFGHFGYDRKYPLLLIDTSTRVTPLYMPDTIFGYSFLKTWKDVIFKAEMALHLFQLRLAQTSYRYNNINPYYNVTPPTRDRFTEYSFGLEHMKTISKYDVTFYLEHIVIKNNNSFRNEEIGFLNNDLLMAVNTSLNDISNSSVKVAYTMALNSSSRQTTSIEFESEWIKKMRYFITWKNIEAGNTSNSSNFLAQLPIEQQFKLSTKYFF